MAFMVWRLGSLAGVTGLDVVIDKGVHVWPVEIAGYDFEGLGLTKVTGSEAIMGLVEDVDLEWL